MTDTPHPPPRREWIDKPAAERVRILGHRAYVGGHFPRMWFEIGRRQFHFLVSRGLRPEHRFLDVACGSLRLGQFVIPFLEAGHYFGLEAEPDLVRAGLEHELLFDIAEQKRPTFGHGYDFDLSFVPGFEVALAQSLFTHLTPEDIALCMASVAGVAGPDSRFFFTYFEGEGPKPKGPSHAQKGWVYTRDEIDGMAHASGWTCDHIGGWGHERGQVMVCATLL
jgi:SAM-dependent methyltransferase